jgi:hypothetical protein
MFFRSKAETEARDKQRQETMEIEDKKLETRLRDRMEIDDKAERYLAISAIGSEMDQRLSELWTTLRKRKHSLHRNIALAAGLPLAAAAATIMTSLVVPVAAVIVVTALAWRLGYCLTEKKMEDWDIGQKKVMHEIAPDFQLADKYKRLAAGELETAARVDLLMLATSDKAEEITKVQPKLKDAMLAALRKAAPKPQPAGSAAPPSVETGQAVTVHGPLMLKARAPG